jgi:peptidoglycan hydrolase-like protein with peptidoglycan-binding domain
VAQAQAALDALLSEAPPADPGHDVQQLEEALVALGYDPDGEVTVDKEFTPATQEMVEAWQEDVGAQSDGVVDFGEVVFLPGPAQVLDVLAPPGSQAGDVVSVATGDPATGTDVRQLEEALVALGYDADGALVADGITTLETNQAVLAFQAATGLEQDGIIDLGEVAFLPGSVRITSQMALKGSSVGAGSTVLDLTLTEKVVYIALPADQQGILAAGDAVTVELPDDTLVPATVTSISQSATPTAGGGATFEAQATLDEPDAVAELDEAPVDVIVVSDSVEGVIAVPVSALVALLEGGYAVEVDAAGGRTQLVPVEVGFFSSNNMVQITSAALQPGDRVVVP